MNRLVVILGPCHVIKQERNFIKIEIKKHWRKDATLSDTISVIKKFTSLKTMFNGTFCFGVERFNQVIKFSSNFVSE